MLAYLLADLSLSPIPTVCVTCFINHKKCPCSCHSQIKYLDKYRLAALSFLSICRINYCHHCSNLIPRYLDLIKVVYSTCDALTQDSRGRTEWKYSIILGFSASDHQTYFKTITLKITEKRLVPILVGRLAPGEFLTFFHPSFWQRSLFVCLSNNKSHQ